MAETDSADALDEMFSRVANDIRLDILKTLWDIYTDDPGPDPDPVPFSTLKQEVGIRDSGQFNYHLDELVPTFVSRHDDGYMLTYAGGRVVGAAVSGVYTETDVTLEATTVDSCPDPSCDGALEARYEQSHIVTECSDCDVTLTMSAPPILVNAHDVEQDPDLLGRFTRAQFQQTIRGFCFLCSGPVEGRIEQLSPDGEADDGDTVNVAYICEECGAPWFTDATATILEHPAVVSLLHDAGIDYREIPSWRIHRTLDSEERILDTDPIRVEVTVTAGGNELTAVLDENLSVLEITRGE